MTREQIALRLLCAALARPSANPLDLDERDMRWALKTAELFQRVSMTSDTQTSSVGPDVPGGGAR